MLTTSIQSRTLNFTPVNNYAVYEDKGKLHIGLTIKRFLTTNKITTTDFARDIDLTRGGLNHIYTQRSIQTDRLETICRAAGFNFFKYFYRKFAYLDEDIDYRL